MKAIVLTSTRDDTKLCINVDNFICAEVDEDETIVYIYGEDGDYERSVKETPEEIANLINNL